MWWNECSVGNTALCTLPLRRSSDSSSKQAIQAASAAAPRAVDMAVNLPPFPLVADARLTAALHDRRKARDDEVLALREQGASLASIAHRLDLDRSTVRRIVRSGTAMAGARGRRAS